MLISPGDLPPMRYYRLTNHEENHRGMQYADGLNQDIVEFRPNGKCSEGGMYFLSEANLWRFNELVSLPDELVWIRQVSFPVDARIWDEGNKYKCDRFILGQRKRLSATENLHTFIDWSSSTVCLAAVQENWLALQYVEEQTAELCLAAVRQNGYARQFVKEQTTKLCLAAVQQDGYALQYVEEQTAELCMAAVQQNGWALKCVKEQTTAVCLASVQQDGRALQLVEEQTAELCLAAVKQRQEKFQFHVSPEILLKLLVKPPIC